MLTRRDLTFALLGLFFGACLGYAGHALTRPSAPERPARSARAERGERKGKAERRARDESEGRPERNNRSAPPSQPEDGSVPADRLEWRDSAPESVLPKGFERSARDAVRACLDDPKVVAMECEEPPCFLLVDSEGAADDVTTRLGACDEWTGTYTEEPLVWRLTRTCEGEERVVLAIAARDSFEHVNAEGGGLAKPKSRLQWRANQLRDRWLCEDSPSAPRAE